MAGTLEVVFLFVLFCSVLNFGTVDLAVRKEATTEQALPPALLLGIRRPEFLFRPSVQIDNTPSKVNYVLCLLIAECSPGPSDHLPSASPSAYRPGTWIFVRGDSYHLTTEEGIIPVDTVTQEAFSHHDVAFTSTPFLLYPDSAQPFVV